MDDPVGQFFEALSYRGPDPRVRGVRGTLQLELERGGEIDYWTVVVSNGSVSALPGRREADCVLRLARDFFETIVMGMGDLFAGLLRSQISVLGDLTMCFYFQRLLPGPPDARDPRTLIPQRGGR